MNACQVMIAMIAPVLAETQRAAPKGPDSCHKVEIKFQPPRSIYRRLN
jgi:hypothetical protein